MTGNDRLPLEALIGDYPVTHALRTHAIKSPLLDLRFADVAVPNTAFKRTVRKMEFDVSELAIMTFLQAHDAGIPLVLLPTVLVSRFQHPYLMYDARRGVVRPEDLRGKRIGVRSYAVTTVSWLRGMLQQDHGIDPSENTWIIGEDAHVEQWRDPDNVQRAPADRSLEAMLEAGEVDAAVLASAPNEHVKPVFSGAGQTSDDWYRRHGVIQINHMVVLKRELCARRPDVPREVFRLLSDSKARAPATGTGPDANPFGIDAVRPPLEFAIDNAWSQRLIRRRFTADELFHPSTLL